MNPLECGNWDELLRLRKAHFIFHTSEWARVILRVGQIHARLALIENGRFSDVIPVIEITVCDGVERGVSFLRAINLVIWKAIRWYAGRGYGSLSFGRIRDLGSEKFQSRVGRKGATQKVQQV